MQPHNEAEPLALEGPSQLGEEQLDYNTWSRIGLNATPKLLADFYAESVDAFTIALGLLVAGNFQSLHDARWTNERPLVDYQSSTNTAKNIIHELLSTEKGSTLFALCAVMTESFSDSVAAKIISEMANRTADHRGITKWHSLIRCCAGTLATTSFRETSMRMSDARDGGPLENNAGARKIADALLGVGSLSRGVWRSIRVFGSLEAGVVAAVAEWMFGLSVTKEDSAMTYTIARPDETPHVDATFDLRKEPVTSRPVAHHNPSVS